MKNSWLFPVIESVHLAGLALLVGTIALVDFRILGLALRGQTVSVVADRLARWTRRGFLAMLTTGPLMFSTDVQRYTHNPAFRFKMAALLVAVAFHFSVYRKAVASGQRAAWPAIVSLLLWAAVVLGGRGIADFDI